MFKVTKLLDIEKIILFFSKVHNFYNHNEFFCSVFFKGKILSLKVSRLGDLALKTKKKYYPSMDIRSFKVFRDSFSEAIPIFFNHLKSGFSLSDRYKFFTSNWL